MTRLPGRDWELGGGVRLDKGRWGERREKERMGGWEELEGMGWLGLRRGGCGSREVYILIKEPF